MTLESLLAAGLTQEEAELILARRQKPKDPSSRLERALLVLSQAQKKTGVHPVAQEDGRLRKDWDPDAEEGLDAFYARKKRKFEREEPQDSGTIIDYTEGGEE